MVLGRGQGFWNQLGNTAGVHAGRSQNRCDNLGIGLAAHGNLGNGVEAGRIGSSAFEGSASHHTGGDQGPVDAPQDEAVSHPATVPEEVDPSTSRAQ